MASEQKNNTGVIFKNDRREKDSHPNGKGTALIDGVEYWVSSWTKDGAKGKFQSLSFTRKEAKNAPAPAPKKEPAKQSYAAASGRDEGGLADELDDEIPF